MHAAVVLASRKRDPYINVAENKIQQMLIMEWP